jgi:Zn-dependent M28 family amino/carboxypeptidase
VPWTSEVAARHARERGDKIVAVFNLDGLGAKGREESGAGRKTNVIVYVGPEGIPLADRFGEVNEAYGLGLVQSTYHAEKPNDDHGSYIKEGFPAAVLAIGSYPYADPNYHHAEDTADKVDIENLALATKACLAAILRTAG